MSIVAMRNGQLKLLKALTEQKWMSRAECYLRKLDPRLFHAQAVPGIVIDTCNACSVSAECLAYSYEAETIGREGIWGGYTPRQRTNLSRGMNVRRFTSAKELETARHKKGTYYYSKKAQNAKTSK